MSRNFGPIRSYRCEPQSDWDDPQPAKTAYERHRDRRRRRLLYIGAGTSLALAGISALVNRFLPDISNWIAGW